MVTYVPESGDIVWMEFEPQQGKEIRKTRPALIISPEMYNRKTGLTLCVPITSQIKKHPFKVILSNSIISGAIVCDQIRSFDWNIRKARFITKVSVSTLESVRKKIIFLIDPDIFMKLDIL